MAPAASAPTGTVTFLDGTNVLRTVPVSGGGTATLTTDALSPGLHTVTARYRGSGPFAGAPAQSTMTVIVGSSTSPPSPAGPQPPPSNAQPPPRSPQPPLPVTGASLPANLAAGVLLLLVGSALVLVTCRRRTARRQST
ncbi:Ig-like domain-containing protein [Micromonospora sp. CPCC 205539]